jgi:hypothetical protein
MATFVNFNLATLVLLCGLIMHVAGCRTDISQNKNCKFGEPLPIFSKDMKGISSHSFNASRQEGKEVLEFDNGLKLEIIQSGCNSIRQEFRFALRPQGLTSDMDYIQLASEQLRFLASVDERVSPLAFWANALDAQKSDMKLAEPRELEPLIFATVDKIESADGLMLRVVLAQGEE